jgi:hypothetical protein
MSHFLHQIVQQPVFLAEKLRQSNAQHPLILALLMISCCAVANPRLTQPYN